MTMGFQAKRNRTEWIVVSGRADKSTSNSPFSDADASSWLGWQDQMAHPYSPAGRGGPGASSSPVTLGMADHDISSTGTVHAQAPSARHRTHHSKLPPRKRVDSKPNRPPETTPARIPVKVLK